MSQQVQLTFADQTTRDQNANCVTEYDGAFARSRCHGPGNDVEVLSQYKELSPGRLQVTLLDPATKEPKAPATELRYWIDDRWMVIERPMAPAGAANGDNKQPLRLKSVSVRVPAKADGSASCQPRGDNHIRVGKTSVSSLALSVPAGWEPMLLDPVTNPGFRAAVDRSFLVGAFAPKSASGAKQFVLVLDDVRFGPAPVREREFREVKKRFLKETGPGAALCDLADRVCAALTPRGSGQVYTELININGRVAMISAAFDRAGVNALPELQKSVATFARQLKEDNAE